MSYTWVEKRREPLFPVLLCCLTYALERAGRVGPALGPGRVALRRVPLGPLPSLPRLRCLFRGVVRRVPGYYGAVRLPVLVHHRRVSSDFSMRPWCAPRQARDLPVPRRDASARARGLRPRRVRDCLARATVVMWPSALFHSVGTLEVKRLSRLNSPARAFPCQRFTAVLAGARRMTRGRCGSLDLHRSALSSVTS